MAVEQYAVPIVHTTIAWFSIVQLVTHLLFLFYLTDNHEHSNVPFGYPFTFAMVLMFTGCAQLLVAQFFGRWYTMRHHFALRFYTVGCLIGCMLVYAFIMVGLGLSFILHDVCAVIMISYFANWGFLCMFLWDYFTIQKPARYQQ